MKKSTLTMLYLLMILSAVFCLAGCKSREQRLNEETEYEETQMKAVREKVIRCIKKDDKEGLKKLFSKSAQKDIEDLDGKIDEMLEAFKGKFFQAEDGIRDRSVSRGLGDVYKRQLYMEIILLNSVLEKSAHCL
nr:DUF5104 domain-containing protein [Mogibacterium diversum]